MAERLRDEPRAAVEGERGTERRSDGDAVGGREDEQELEHAERHGQPARLVVEHAVVDEDVQREPDAEHQPRELDRPPGVDEGREDARRQQRQ